MSDFNLNTLIDEALAGDEKNPHVIGRRLVTKVPLDEHAALLGELLAYKVRERIRFPRTTPAADHRSLDAHTTSVGGRSGGRSRWLQHLPEIARAVSLRAIYQVGDDWKAAEALTAEDCDALAAGYAKRAAENAAYERVFTDLAARLREAGVETLGDLGDDLSVAA